MISPNLIVINGGYDFFQQLDFSSELNTVAAETPATRGDEPPCRLAEIKVHLHGFHREPGQGGIEHMIAES